MDFNELCRWCRVDTSEVILIRESCSASKNTYTRVDPCVQWLQNLLHPRALLGYPTALRAIMNSFETSGASLNSDEGKAKIDVKKWSNKPTNIPDLGEAFLKGIFSEWTTWKASPHISKNWQNSIPGKNKKWIHSYYTRRKWRQGWRGTSSRSSRENIGKLSLELLCSVVILDKFCSWMQCDRKGQY